MNTTENNKIIAEFMGLKNIKDAKGDAWDYMNTGKSIYTLRTKDLHYNSDWNWLMEVVEKIINLKEVYAQERQKVFNSISPDKEAVYNACLEFIKWYNE